MLTLLFAALVVVTPDPDLAARIELASPPGTTLVVLGGEPLPPSPLCSADDTCDDGGRELDINWGSAPEAVVAYRVSAEDLAGTQVILRTLAGDPILFSRTDAGGRPTVYLAFDASGDTRRWPYFNYLLHATASRASGHDPPRFADWSGSPLPGSRIHRAVALGLAALWLAAMLLFRRARRRGRLRTDAAAVFLAALGDGNRGAGGSRWNRAGFTRPLAGLLTIVGGVAAFAGPYLILQWLIGSKVQPFPQADGMWKTVADMLWFVLALFEVGTEVACAKYFAEDRVKTPRRALADLQFYVWWQVFAKLSMATALLLTAFGILPYTHFALYAPFLALYATVWLPGCNSVGKVVCLAIQRYDVHTLLDLIERRVLMFVCWVPTVLIFRAWGAGEPQVGEAFGAAIGLGVGQLLSNLLSLCIGLVALRRLKIPIWPLFLAQFDGPVARRILAFGGKLTVGANPEWLFASIESVIIIYALKDFTLWQGIRDLLFFRMCTLFMFQQTFYSGAMTSLTEALAAGKRLLARYYIARFFQFSYLYCFTIASLVLAIGPSFIEALGPGWSPALPYLVPVVIVALCDPPSAIGDAVLKASGRAWTYSIVLLAEQAVRMTLFWIFIPRLGFGGIPIGSAGGLLFRGLLGWILIHRNVIHLRVAGWATFGAPVLAAAVNYALWAGLVTVLPPTSVAAALGAMCIGGTASFFVTFFVCGLAGGFDRFALRELDDAGGMTTFLRPLCRALARTAALGARLSAVKTRPLELAEGAHAEADALDAEAQDVLDRARQPTLA